MMFIAKKHISRRTALRGIGVSLALPLLDSMVPAQTPLRKTAASPPSRLACIEMVHGAAGSTDEGAGKHYWSPAKDGADFEFSYSLEPLAPFREYVTIVSGTDARQADAFVPSEGGADHFRSSAVFLTATHPKQTEGPDIFNGTSIDQVYAQQFGKDTPLPSIQLAIENIALSGSCGFQYSCVYSETISWASPTTPLPMTVNPRVAFENLFAEAGSAADRTSLRPPNRSILDGLGPQAARFQSQLGPQDRDRLHAYLEDIRGVERRIQAVEKQNATAEKRELPAAPLGVPDSWEDHVKLMFDLQVLAFAAEVTRVSAFKMSRDTSNRVFPGSGVKDPFHTLSHHSGQPDLIAEFAKLNRYHVGLVPYFLQKLKNTPDGDGSLLDHSLVLYGSSMGDSNSHNHRRVPLFLAGHAGGQLKGNLHRVCKDGTPQANALLTVMHKLGVDIESVGDSTGAIAI
ncbi:MAG TPA: DUF1552 domain-containing protein [Bryobacteraceae bacterium]|jgi:hypothetical protein|nr:DUF1552 domain-containing protein [Bryobacteraceae bacterium]